MVAYAVFSQQDQVVTGFVLFFNFNVGRAGYIRLAPQNRLDLWQILKLFLGRVAGIVERLQGEQVAVVGNRQRRHSPFAGALHQRVYLALPVEQRVRGVDVEMDEIRHGGRPGFRLLERRGLHQGVDGNQLFPEFFHLGKLDCVGGI